MKLKRLTALLLAGCLITPNIGRVIAVENTGNQAETGNEDTNDGIKDDSNPEDENNNSGNEGEEGNNPGTGNEGTGDGSEDNSNPEDGNGSESSGTEGEDETDNEGNGETENPGEGEDNTEGEVIEPEDPNQLPEGEENNEELTEETDEIIEYAENAIFVSATGSDSNSGETEEEPVATLAKAVGIAESGDTIYLLSDLTLNEMVSVWHKHLIINGNGFTITRGENFNTNSDPARESYNPAMIEVGGQTGQGTVASLRLENIILDDVFQKEGDHFVQADSEGDGTTTIYIYDEHNELVETKEISNTAIVQDAIIATYNGTGTITLGNGATLQNYGGMSAVRLSGGTLVMESGSKIIDTGVRDTTKQPGNYGAAGAIWIQGGEVIVEDGAFIGSESDSPMIGRAIYLDGGTATVNGTISNIQADGNMWQGRSGVAIHVRGGATASLLSEGRISHLSSDSPSNAHAISAYGSDFMMESGSEIHDLHNMMAANADDLGHEYSHKFDLNGEIYNCTTSDSLMRSWYGTITIGPNCIIHDNTANGAGGLLYTNNGSKYVINGKIINNTAPNGAIYLANQSGGRVSAVMKGENAEISGNSAHGVRVNNGSLFIMNGGSISNNGSYGVRISGKTGFTGVQFIMNGGIIAENSSEGVRYENVAGSESTVELNAGTIINNGTDYQIYASGGNSEQDSERIRINSGILKNETTVLLSAGIVTLDVDYIDVMLGNAQQKAVEKIKSLVLAEHPDWTVAGSSALWLKPLASQGEYDYHFKITRPSNANGKGLFACYIPLNSDGTPQQDAAVTCEEVKDATIIDVTMKKLIQDTSYALMFFNNTEYVLRPDDLTIYAGGDLPTEFSLNNLIEITTLTVDNVLITDENPYDYLESLFTIEYTDNMGNLITGTTEPGEYTARLKWKDGINKAIKINGNDVNIGTAGLIIRYVEEIENIQNKSILKKLVTQVSELVTNATAIALGTNPIFYVNDSLDNVILDTSGIAILDDSLLQGSDNRQQLLEEKAIKEVLGNPEEGNEYVFDFHYLDLVDTNNGNAWVSASYGTTVYLPYPEGMTKDSAEYQVLHFEGLHREYNITGPDVITAIANCTVESVESEATEYGIQFDVGRAGFSPFAVVWQEKSDVIDPEPGEDELTVTVINGTLDDGRTSGTFTEGDNVEIIADPAPSGQVFDRWVVESGDAILTDAANPPTSFTMPASNVTVRATYKDDGNGGGTDPVFDYRVDVENGTLENGRDYGYFESGETVEIFADEIEGQRFVRWETETRGVTFEDETDPTTSFIMPRRNVTVVAVYESEPTDPSEPTEPGEPTDPQEPTEPSEPIDPVEPTEPTEPSEPEIDETPDTGARQSIALWLMLGISLMGIAAAFVLMKKEKLNK